MKLYETMSENENLSWCRPYVSEDGKKAIVVNEGEIVSSEGLNVNDVSDLEIDEIIDNENLYECGCAGCPWQMNVIRWTKNKSERSDYER